jgi:CheY-like chemotaxis protein
VTTRTSSIEALELFQTKSNDFDLVVTDMTMPNLTGDKLAIELMKIRPDIPVILCTGCSKKISDETQRKSVSRPSLTSRWSKRIWQKRFAKCSMRPNLKIKVNYPKGKK